MNFPNFHSENVCRNCLFIIFSSVALWSFSLCSLISQKTQWIEWAREKAHKIYLLLEPTRKNSRKTKRDERRRGRLWCKAKPQNCPFNECGVTVRNLFFLSGHTTPSISYYFLWPRGFLYYSNQSECLLLNEYEIEVKYDAHHSHTVRIPDGEVKKKVSSFLSAHLSLQATPPPHTPTSEWSVCQVEFVTWMLSAINFLVNGFFSSSSPFFCFIPSIES